MRTEVDGIEILHDKDSGIVTLVQDDDKIFLNEDYVKDLMKSLAKTFSKEKK